MDPEKQKMNLQNHAYNADWKISSSHEESRTQLLIFILYSSLSIGLLFLLIPHQNVNGSPVPAFLFAAHPSLFHVLVFCVMLSFASASSALLIKINSKHATIWRFYFTISVVSFTSALSILACILFLETFKLVSSGIKLWQLNEDESDSILFYRFRKNGPAFEHLSEIS